ncbi:MAG: hypothetical protein ACXVA2_03090, partial [Mucilaginibacter sp.]
PFNVRPFKIPFNITGLCVMIALPLIVYGVALTGAVSSLGEGIKPALFAICALLTAELAWWLTVWWRSALKIVE